MNKIFKVVWSKTKECYVVVSEVAKNNGGKKKVLASVLAGLAMVGVAAQMGTPVQADSRYNKSTIVVAPNGLSPAYSSGTYKGSENNDVSYNSIVVGFLNNAYDPSTNGHFIFGANNKATNESTLALGNNNEATGPSSTAIGSGSEASGRNTIAMGNVAKANQIGNLAIGSYAKAQTSGTFMSTVTHAPEEKGYAVALGGYAEATEHSTVAVGAVSKASGFKATAVGAGAQAKGDNSTVVGTASVANSGDSFVGGFKNVTHGDRNVAVGTNNTVAGEDSIGVGSGVIATTGKTIAIGNTMVNPTYPNGRQTIARGKNKLDGSGNPMYGTTDVDNIFALAIGNGAQADGTAKSASGMIAIGQEVTADNNNTVAIGVQTKATGSNALAIGSTAQAIGASSAAFGTQAVANGLGATAFGPGASAGDGSTVADGSTAVGRKSTVTAEGGTGIGWATTVSAKDATAIGHSATANIVGGVALGSNSVTTTAAGVQGYNPATGRTNKYSDQNAAVGTSTLAAVSVGNGTTATRQITGLAAGTDDTDAVNVAQLKNVNLKYAADTGNSDVLLKDGTLKVKGDNDLISTSVVATGADKGAVQITAKVGGTINNTDGKAVKPTTNGIATTDNVADAINNSYWKATAGGNTDGTPSVGNVKPGTQVTYSAGDNLKVKQTIAANGNQEYKYSLNPVLTGITSIANTTTGPKMTFGGNSINITGGSLDMGNNKITNLATGTDDKDAVNVKQLKDTEIHITPGTYTPDSNKKVTLTYENGDNKTVAGKTAVIDLSGLATGGTASTEKVQKAANAANDTNIAEVNPKTGDTFGGAGATYEVSVSRNAVKDAAREAVTINNGGTKSGTTYTPNADNPITVTPKEDAANHNTTYEVTFDGNKAAKQIPLTYKATNGTTTTADQTVKLDKGLNFTGGDYTTASVGADGKVTFDVNLGTAPTVTDGKPGVPGQAGAAGKDGIATVKTVVDTINNSGWKANAKANGGKLDGTATATIVKPGNTVNYAAGNNLIVKQELETDASNALTGNQTYTYSLNKDIDLTNAGSLTVGDTTVNNGGITIKAPTPAAGTTATTTDVKLTNTGLNNGGNKIVNVAEGKADTDAVNVKQLKDAKTKLVAGENTTVEGDGTTATPYKVNVKGDLANISSITNGAGSGKISFGNDQVVTVNGDHPISLNGKTGDITGLTNTTIPTAAGSDFATKGRAATEEQLKVVNDKFNNKINLGADTNETTKFQLDNASGIKFNIKGDGSGTGGANQYISTTANGSNVNVDLTADAKAKLNKTYTVSSGSTNVTVTPTTTGDNTDFKITVASTGTTTSSSWNLATDKVSATEGTVAAGSAATQNIADTKTVTMQAGKNLTVKQTNDGAGNASVAYSLDKDISVENITVTGQNGKDGSIGINGKDGVTRNITVEVPGQAGQPGTPGVDGTTTTRIVFDGKAQANLDDGLKFTGNNESTENKHKLNTLVKVQGEGTKEGTDAAGAKEIQTSDGTKFESAKDNIAVEANGADTLTVKLNKNLKGLDSVTTKEIKLGDANDNISIKKDGDRITYTTNNGGTTTTNKVANLGDELHITPGTYEIGATNKDAAAKNDEVTLTYTDGNGVEKANTFAKIKGVAKSDLSNISNDGKKVITGLGSVVKAGDNVTVKTDTDATTGQKTYTVNAVTPAVYTKADGTKVIKRPDGTFTTNLDGSAGNDVPASDVIVSFQDAAGNTTGGNSIVNNVGSAIDKTGTSTGDTFLTKLDNAATATPNAAVNVKDLKNTSDAIIGKGLKFDANEGGEKTNKLGSKVTVQGSGALTAGKAYADEYNTANIRTNIEQGTDGNTTINVGLAKALKDINSISNGSSSITISDVPAGATTPAVTISGGNLSMGDGTTNNKIVNLAPGTDGTDAVNLNQLKGMRTVVTSTDKSVTVTSNENSTTGQVTYDLKVSTTGTVAKSTWNLNSGVVSATEGTHVGDTTQNIADTKTVTMQAGKNLTVTQTNDTAGNASVAYSLDKDISVETVTVTGQNGKDGSIGINGKDGVTRNITVEVPGQAGQPGTPGVDGTTTTRIVFDGKAQANLDDGLKFTGNNESTENKHKLNTLVKVQGEGTKEGTDAAGAKEIQTSDGTKFESAKDNIAVEANGADTLTVKLNKNLKGLDSVTTKEIKLGDANDNISIKKDGDRITYTTNNGGTTTTNKVANLGDELHITPGTYEIGATNKDAAAKNDEVTLTYTDGNGVEKANTFAKIKGVAKSDLSNISNDGKKVITGLGSVVKAGDNVTVKTDTDATTGQKTYTVNAVTPAVYTKADGTKVIKRPDGTFTTNLDGSAGNDVPASDVIVSFQDAAGDTKLGNSIINNVGSAIDKPGTATGNTFLTQLDNAAANTPFAAVNVRDLKTTADALKANERHIAPTTVATGSTETKGGTANAAGTANVYKYDATSKTVTLTYNDGNGNAVTDTKAVIDLSNLSTGGTGASSWNIASDKVSATEGAVAAGSAGTQNIADGKTVTMKAGKNLTVNQSNDGAGNASVAFSLDKNLENLDKVVVNGNDGATGQAGVSIVGPKGANGVDGNDGKVGIAGKDGKDAVSISGKDGVGHIGLQGPKGTPGTPGAPGAPGANLDITTDHGTQTLVKPERNNNNQSERIVYVPKDANGNPLKDTDGNDIKREVATMDDGLKFTGNNTSTENKRKLGSLLKVQGEDVSAADEAAFQSAGGNIAVTANGSDTLTIRLNKNLKGLNSIQLGGNTIQSNGDNITFTTNGGTTKTVATTDQLWTIQANGTDVPAKSGKVNLVAGDHITITPDAANGKMTISATGFGSMDGFNVKTSAESATVGTHAGDTTENIKNGKTVDMQAGKNLVVTQTNDGNGNTTVNYALNKDVDLGTNGSLKAGDTTVNKDGVTIANGPSITKTGVDAGDKKITNVADGAVNATSKDAVNGSQLKKYTDAAKTTVEAGDNNVKVDTDTTAADGHTNYKVSLKPVVTIGDTHKVKIDGQTGDITGLTNVDLTDPTFATKGRAATEEQLNKVLTEAKKKAVEKVQAGTAAAGDTNIATVAPKAGDTFGAAGATYEVSVSKNAVKDAAKEAVKVTSASPAITVTADTSVAHETTYKVGFDGNQAATQIPLTYKQNGGNTRTVKLSDGLNFIDGTNTKARTAADGKVTFDVMGDLTGITSISNAAGGPKMTFGGNSINVTNGDLNMGGNKITNLGKGTATTDAATVGQLTKVTSNNHSVVINKTTDANGAPVYDLAVSGTPGAPAADPRVDMLGEEIGRVGAQGAALSALKPIQYDPLEPTQIMAGYGNYRGNSAVALGVAHYKNESTLIHGGVSWAGGSSHMMANAGVTWKVGNRDSEAAVADRYRKGPISSAYAMQQEMAAMKAQNAGLKGEVSDLKAENEQMKAQIAAMMAKLGL